MGFFDRLADGGGPLGTVAGLFGAGTKTRLREIQSPQEQQFVQNLGNRAKFGTIDINYLNQVQGRTASQIGNINRNRFQGQMMNQGLGNSIITQELMRKTDRETLTSLADESRKIALANEMSKIKAEDMLGEYGLMRSNRLMGIAQANAEYKRAEAENRGNIFDSIGSIFG